MLWMTLTRIDMVADVVLLQQKMVTPIIKDIKQANAALHKANANAKMNGLHFKYLAGPLRVLAISDASHVSRTSLHAQEGRMVVLTRDPVGTRLLPEWISEDSTNPISAYGHPLFISGRKAQRVSHSTSHAESLSVLGGVQVAQLIANRLTEPFYKVLSGITRPRPIDCLVKQNRHEVILPIDCHGLHGCLRAYMRRSWPFQRHTAETHHIVSP